MSTRGARLLLCSLALFVTSACTAEQGAPATDPQESDAASNATDTLFGSNDTVAVPPDTITDGSSSPDTTAACETNADCTQAAEGLSACQVALCNTATQACVVGPSKDYTPCDDDDGCTAESVCMQGTCEGSVALNCEDGNPCTDDGCDSSSGCQWEPNTAPCDDGNACTAQDACSDGVCMGTADPSCACDTDAECLIFDDGNLCNGKPVCVGGACETDPSSAIVCPDLSEDPSCLVHICEPATGACVIDAATDGMSCTDGNPCTADDACVAGVCQGAPSACACTEPADCAEFDDSNLCNGSLTCTEGTCVTSVASVVNCETSENPCETAACEPDTGACVASAVPNGTGCDDGNACTAEDTCIEGSCAGPALDCGDSGPCISVTCDPLTGCESTLTDGPCDDGDACTSADSCVEGTCAGTPWVPSPTPPCAEEICDPASGPKVALLDGVACDDGDPCTLEDACVAGLCTGGSQDPSCTAGDCCAEAESPGCNEPTCEALVCAEDTFCCEDVWDDVCVETAFALCPACGASGSCGDGVCDVDLAEGCANCEVDCGVCTPGDCCTEQASGGCTDVACEDLVCAIDTFCCDAIWDGLCAETALDLCGVCDDTPATCGDGDCGEAETCSSCPQDCGPCTGSDCCIASETAGCGDDAVAACACEEDAYCCETAWDPVCVEMATIFCDLLCEDGPTTCGDGTCDFDEACETCPIDCGPCGATNLCCAPGPAGLCVDPLILSCACFVDTDCCEGAWTEGCVTIAQDLCGLDCESEPALCGNGACDPDETCALCPSDCGACEPGSCCDPAQSPSCDDTGVAECVCEDDLFCCEWAWDEICVEMAMDLCDLSCLDSCGDGVCTESCETCPLDCGPCDPQGCCEATTLPGCPADPALEACVCAFDIFCCEMTWDAFCAEQAIACGGCEATCGDGLCSEGQESCETCLEDCGACPTCGDGICDAALGETCDGCEADCGPCVAGLCCVATYELGCPSDPELEACVCGLDPFCCDNSWDTLCAGEAVDCGGCPTVCGDGVCTEGEESCETCPGDCGACPFCGDGVCDQFITGEEDCESCPQDCGPCSVPGDCCTPQTEPGCGGGPCEETVCALDPYCCATMWDVYCVGCATDGVGFGELECGTAPPICGCSGGPACGNGSCEEGEGCADCPEDCGVCPAICGDGACNGTESCVTCDLDCDTCVGDCCAPNNTPGCEFEVITECVCELDTTCCEGKWTEGCVALANTECFAGCDAVFCGDGSCDEGEGCDTCTEDCGACDGACCEAHEAPGCEDPAITECVCANDPACCQSGWDDDCVQGVTAFSCGACTPNP